MDSFYVSIGVIQISVIYINMVTVTTAMLSYLLIKSVVHKLIVITD